MPLHFPITSRNESSAADKSAVLTSPPPIPACEVFREVRDEEDEEDKMVDEEEEEEEEDEGAVVEASLAEEVLTMEGAGAVVRLLPCPFI